MTYNVFGGTLNPAQSNTPASHHSVFFTDYMPFLPPNQQRQSTEGISTEGIFLIHQQTTIQSQV